MKVNVYVLVFGAIALIFVLAALSTLVFNKSPSTKNVTLTNLTDYGPAPDVQGISYWIDSQPLHLSQLKGKVVLIDFWTYSCINCIRTIPYLNAWQNKYGNSGLVIIGVHTPEFQFETNYSNVKAAVQRFGIKYAVAMDSNYSTWTAYNNHYWPAHYLIDKNGHIRAVQFGEGNYNGTELVIQELLKDAGYNVASGIANISSIVNFSQRITPEIYLGYGTSRAPIGNKEGFSPLQAVYYMPTNLAQNNTPYFSGQWFNMRDSMVSYNNSKLFLIYRAKYVNVVASGNSTITIKMDGKTLTQSYLGSDAKLVNGTAIVNVNSSRLYNIIAAPSYGYHTLEIDAKPNFRIYTFTFG